MSLADQQWCPTSVQVTVLQARGLRIKGKSGTNDAYAVMQVGKEKYQTSVVEKSVTPVWKEEAAFDLPPLLQQGGGGGGTERSTLHVHVLHRALVGPDKLLGQAVINLLQLSEDKTRNKTEWFKLLDKTGKADKDRGEVLVDIQFMRNNMTASMFDLSAAGKSRSRLGKIKDKVRGKKKESDTASTVVPSFTQVLTDSEEEGNRDGEVVAGKDVKKKKLKMKSLFSPKSNLQRNMSQSMSVLPAKNSSLSGSQSSGLNVDSSEGKKKFKFMMHKRSGSSDSKDSSSGHQKHGTAEQSNLCINGSHVYCEEPQPRTSRIGSNFSLTSSGHGSMEDVPESSPPSVDSLRVVRQYSPWTEEEEEEEEEEETAEVENIKEDVGELRREEEERIRIEEEERIRKEEEEERVRRQEQELERLAEEKRRREEEERRRTEEEKVKREEEEKIRREEEEKVLEKRKREEERVRREEEEERKRLAEEKRRLEEEERRRIEEEEKRQREEEERIRVKEEMAKEERRRQEEERKLEEEKRRMEEERRSIEEEKVRKEKEERAQEERRRREEEDMVRRQEEELEEKKRLEEQERRQREEEERIKKEEEEKARREKEEYERLVEEKRKLEEEERKKIEAEEKTRREEEEKIRVEEERRIKEEERIRRQEEEREKLAEEKKILEEQERMRIEEEEKRQREEEERIRIDEERRRKEEEERVRRQEEEELERLAEEKRRQEEEERRRTEEEKVKREKEERIRREEEERAQEERRQEEEERARREKEEIERLAEEKRRLEEQEKRSIEEEERIRREEKAEEARKLEKEKLTADAEEQKKRENKTKHKVAGKKSEVAVEVTSTNPFDENISNNPFEEIPSSHAGPNSSTAKVSTVQQRCQSAVSSVGSKTVSTDEKGFISSHQEKRPAPQPPVRNQAESQREPNGSTPQLAQINKQSKDKEVKTVSILPQRSVQMIAPLSRSPTDSKNTQSLMQSSTTKETSNVAKHSKRPAPSRPRSVEEGPSSDPKTALSSDGNISHECGSEAKQEPVVYGLNPFEDDEDENELTAQDDSTTSGKSGSNQWPPGVSQAPDKDGAPQTKIKSSKVARAPPLPAKKAATPSILINQNTEGDHITDDRGMTVHDNSVTHACDPKSEAVSRVRVQETPLQESPPATVQSAAEEAGGKKERPPTTSRRLQPVKPLNPLEQQSASVVQGEKDNKSTGILCEVQKKTKVNDTGLKGPYSQLTQEELISLVLKQKNQLSEKDNKISELEQYIDNLLVRVIEEQPSILMSMNSLKKPV